MKHKLESTLPGEFHGHKSLASYSPWGHKKLEVTEWLTLCTVLFTSPLDHWNHKTGWCELTVTSPPMNEKNVHRLITLSLSDYYKTPCFPLQVGTHSFKGISLLWEILKEMGIPDHFIFLLRNLYAGWEVTIRTRHGTMDWFQIGKGVGQGCILSPCLFNFYAEYIMWNARLDESQAGIKIAGRNINNLGYEYDTTLMAESEEELKKPLDESERGEWKGWLKAQHSENEDHGIWSHHFVGNR